MSKVSKHLTVVDGDAKTVNVFRVNETGPMTLFTSISFEEAEKLGHQKFLTLFAENIFLDSRVGRELLDLMDPISYPPD